MKFSTKFRLLLRTINPFEKERVFHIPSPTTFEYWRHYFLKMALIPLIWLTVTILFGIFTIYFKDILFRGLNDATIKQTALIYTCLPSYAISLIYYKKVFRKKLNPRERILHESSNILFIVFFIFEFLMRI